jgi:hypothetical protein
MQPSQLPRPIVFFIFQETGAYSYVGKNTLAYSYVRNFFTAYSYVRNWQGHQSIKSQFPGASIAISQELCAGANWQHLDPTEKYK